MDFEKEKEAEKRRRTIRLIEEGMKTEFWSLLSGEVAKLVQRNEKYLEGFNRKPFREEKDIQEHAHTVISTNFMKWFLKLPDRMIEDNLSFFKKMERFAKRAVERVNSFVK